MDRIDNESEIEVKIEGATNRVASVTLESDSLSETPLSARSKRRRKASKKDRRYNTFMDIDPKPHIKTELASTTKFSMDWEGLPQSDVSSGSSCSDNQDADDEQSDWPGYKEEREESAAALTTTSTSFLAPPTRTISNSIQKRIERFLYDPNQKEMLLHQIYKTTNIKKLVQNLPVQIQKRERGTILLKKI